ncbi:MAG: LysM peptidoglycan-binding domain-containing protein [Alphaproteobacteria bacterium]|nr:MAG: LysM peptidoglycan-binding domain-containing protein [Alphaproteobacteria bacterium]
MRRCLIIFFCFLIASAAGAPAQAAVFYIRGDVAGATSQYTVKAKETLYDVARRFDLGILELQAANPGIPVRKPAKGAVLVIPALHALPPVREGLVIDLRRLRLFYFDGTDRVYTFPIGTGKDGWQTPQGVTKIVRKKKAPSWTPPDSIRAEDPTLPAVVPPGPDNPLGQYALYLGWSGYAMHGTNRPSSIGTRASHGCIRLYPEDIKVLFEIVEPGTQVVILGESGAPD